MGFVIWSELSMADAQRLTGEWEATRERRLAWLEEQLGEPLRYDEDGLATVWQWYCTWVQDPVGAAGEPTPVWWVDGEDAGWTPYTRDQGVGADAIGHLLEEILIRRFPILVRVVPPRGRLKYPPAIMHSPTLNGADGDPYWPVLNVCGLMDSVAEAATEGAAERVTSTAAWRARGGPLEDLRRGIELATALGRRSQRPEPVAGPPFTLEENDDEDHPWLVGIDDVVAHEHEDLVARFAADLATAPGVTEAVHQDRELILLVGTIDPDQLTAWADAWWAKHPLND